MIAEKLEKEFELKLIPSEIKDLIKKQLESEGYELAEGIGTDGIKFEVNSGSRLTGIGSAESNEIYANFMGATFKVRKKQSTTLIR